MSYQKIILSKVGKIATITLNRPEVLNALDGDILEEIIDAIGDIEKDSNIWVVVLDSNCEKAFSSGIDVEFVKDYDPWTGRLIGKLLHRTFGAVRALEKPVISAINGLCLGAGLELAISGDILIASDCSKFGLPNINIGIPAIVEAAILLPAIGLFGTKELCFTGKYWDVERAKEFNLLNSVVAPGELKAEVKRWADLLAGKSPRGLATQKDIINKWMTTDLETAIDYSIQTVTLNFVTKDQKEGMEAFLEKRKAKFTGE
jgi:enoyl-CoA hydratase